MAAMAADGDIAGAMLCVAAIPPRMLCEMRGQR
jgi:hypothetical protein